MRSIATVRSFLWSPRLLIAQPARAGLGGTNGSAEDQTTPPGTRGWFESPQRRSEFGDFTGRLARKTNGASSHVVARTANGASSDVVLGELSPSLSRLGCRGNPGEAAWQMRQMQNSAVNTFWSNSGA